METKSNSNNHGSSMLERLAMTSPNLEIWWDSSPLVYQNWADNLLRTAPEEKRSLLKEQIQRLFDPQAPTSTLFRGVTTNPPLSLQAINNDPERWKAWIKSYLDKNPQADVEKVFWELYKHTVTLGAEVFLPVFNASGYRFGHLSGQVDPRNAFDADKMLAQGLELATLAPNLMVKVPQTTEGINVIRELTARGISTNGTLGYVVSQFKAVAEAVQEGLEIARANHVDLTHWRSVITQMSVRWENEAIFAAQATEAGVNLTPALKRWASIDIFKKAHALMRRQAYPSKMLICSLRMGPTVEGVERVWHIEKITGADAVFTLPPSYISELLLKTDHIDLTPGTIWDGIPAEDELQLNKIEYYRRAVDENGYRIEEFSTLPPVLTTAKEFKGATEKMVDFVRQNMGQLVEA